MISQVFLTSELHDSPGFDVRFRNQVAIHLVSGDIPMFLGDFHVSWGISMFLWDSPRNRLPLMMNLGIPGISTGFSGISPVPGVSGTGTPFWTT